MIYESEWFEMSEYVEVPIMPIHITKQDIKEIYYDAGDKYDDQNKNNFPIITEQWYLNLVLNCYYDPSFKDMIALFDNGKN